MTLDELGIHAHVITLATGRKGLFSNGELIAVYHVDPPRRGYRLLVRSDLHLLPPNSLHHFDQWLGALNILPQNTTQAAPGSLEKRLLA